MAQEEMMCHSRMRKGARSKQIHVISNETNQKSVLLHTVERTSTNILLLAVPVITSRADRIPVNAVGIWIKKTVEIRELTKC
jgi:hypothetical protein